MAALSSRNLVQKSTLRSPSGSLTRRDNPRRPQATNAPAASHRGHPTHSRLAGLRSRTANTLPLSAPQPLWDTQVTSPLSALHLGDSQILRRQSLERKLLRGHPPPYLTLPYLRNTHRSDAKASANSGKQIREIRGHPSFFRASHQHPTCK